MENCILKHVTEKELLELGLAKSLHKVSDVKPPMPTMKTPKPTLTNKQQDMMSALIMVPAIRELLNKAENRDIATQAESSAPMNILDTIDQMIKGLENTRSGLTVLTMCIMTRLQESQTGKKAPMSRDITLAYLAGMDTIKVKMKGLNMANPSDKEDYDYYYETTETLANKYLKELKALGVYT